MLRVTPVTFQLILVFAPVSLLMLPLFPVSIIPVSLLVFVAMPPVFTPVLIIIEIGPVAMQAQANPVIIVNTDIARKPSDMIPATMVVMIIVAAAGIEVDIGRGVVIVVVPWLLIGDHSSTIGNLITGATTNIIGIVTS